MATTYAKVRGFAKTDDGEPTFSFWKIENSERAMSREDLAAFLHTPVEDVILLTEEEYCKEQGED